jgi:hypothetical protein
MTCRLTKKQEDRDVEGAKVVGLKSEYINIELPHAISFNGLNEGYKQLNFLT